MLLKTVNHISDQVQKLGTVKNILLQSSLRFVCHLDVGEVASPKSGFVRFVLYEVVRFFD